MHIEPTHHEHCATARTFVPTRLPLRAFFSSQLNSSLPLASASFRKQLVT